MAEKITCRIIPNDGASDLIAIEWRGDPVPVFFGGMPPDVAAEAFLMETLYWYCHPCDGCHREGDRSCVCGGSHRACERITEEEAREMGIRVEELEVVR